MAEFESFDSVRNSQRLEHVAAPEMQRALRFGIVVIGEADQVARAMDARRIPYTYKSRNPNPRYPSGWNLGVTTSHECQSQITGWDGSEEVSRSEIVRRSVYDNREYVLTPTMPSLRYADPVLRYYFDRLEVEDFAAPISAEDPKDLDLNESAEEFFERISKVRGALARLANEHGL